MGRKANDTTITVVEGLYLKQIGDSLHCYFRLGGKQFRRSTKTMDLAAAKLKALQWHKDAVRKLDAGEDVECVSFARLKRSYLDQIKGHGKFTYHAPTIERHFLPFFARFDDVSKIRKGDILDYLKFRNAQGDAAPTPQTINRENTVLRQMLRHAADRGWLKTVPQIDNQSERLTRRRRRHFTLEEYRVLYRTARRRVHELDGIPLRTRQREQRQLLLDYILLLANTGLRVDEAKTLIWRNVDWENKSLLLEHAGKTKSTRRVLMREGAVAALRRIHQRRTDYLGERRKEFDLKEKIVALSDGKAIASFKKGFNELLSACGFLYDSVFEKHALTSLRHTYATFRLTTKSGTRASVRALAKQMGTSEKMIERHYGHDVVEDYRRELVE
jgi:integrase